MSTWKMTVININTHLNVRNGPGLNYDIIGKRRNGDTFVADKCQTSADGYVWYREKDKKRWSCMKTASGQRYLKAKELESDTKSEKPKQDKSNEKTEKDKKIKENGADTSVPAGTPRKVNSSKSGSGLGVPSHTKNEVTTADMSEEDIDEGISQRTFYSIYNAKLLESEAPEADDESSSETSERNNTWNSITKQFVGAKSKGLASHYMIYNNNSYPKANPARTQVSFSGAKHDVIHAIVSEHDYSINLPSTIINSFDKIKKNLNAPTAYDRNELNVKTHSRFNRYHIVFPDLYLKGATSVIFFTRPDLNILSTSTSTSNILNSQINNDLRIYYTSRRHPELTELLSSSGGYLTKSTTHNFNPLLSNLADSMDILDDTIDTLETGETWNGYKLQYAKHNIKCMTPGTLSIKFKETFDLSITNIHQLWVDYMAAVYMGTMFPKPHHIYYKELDYMCNIYYFLLSNDRKKILFWAKYYGCFPTTVPKSQYSYDFGNNISLPDATVTYNYIMKRELDPCILAEFNRDGGASLGDEFESLPDYSTTLSQGGRTWAGIPFISQFQEDKGFGTDGFDNELRLEFRKIKDS